MSHTIQNGFIFVKLQCVFCAGDDVFLNVKKYLKFVIIVDFFSLCISLIIEGVYKIVFLFIF